MAEFLKVEEVKSEEKPLAVREREIIEEHQQEEPPAETKENPVEEQPELEDAVIFQTLTKRLNKTINSFDDLIEKEVVEKEVELPEDVATFLKYKKETGRGIDDFMKLNRDLSTLSDEEKLMEYYSMTEEALDKEDILSKIKEFEVDEDLDTETEMNRKRRERKKALNDANKFFNAQKESYKVPLVSSPASAIPDEEKEEFESYKQYIQTARDVEEQNQRKREWFDQKSQEVFSKDFKGFDFKVKVGEEEKGLTFAPGTPDELKTLQSSPLNFINKFMDENGMIKDAAGYHRGLAVAMNPEKFAQFFIDQGYAMAIESQAKQTKNISMDIRTTPQPLVKDGIKVQEVKSPGFDSGLKILSAKRV